MIDHLEKLSALLMKIKEWNAQKDFDTDKLEEGKKLAADFFETIQKIFTRLTPQEKNAFKEEVKHFFHELEKGELMNKIYAKRIYEKPYAMEPPVECRLEIGSYDVEAIGASILEGLKPELCEKPFVESD